MDLKTFAQNNIDWLGHASFRIRGRRTLYIDPWKIGTVTNDGDLVLCTHFHYDHYSAEDIEKVIAPSGKVILPRGDEGIEFPEAIRLAPSMTVKENDVVIHAVPAYNLNKKFHPEEMGGIGYIIEMDNIRIYHAGDTDVIPEMNEMACDIALLPASGTYVMTAKEAAEAAMRVKAKVAIPMHWGDIVGDRSDADLFDEKAPCTVVIKANPRG